MREEGWAKGESVSLRCYCNAARNERNGRKQYERQKRNGCTLPQLRLTPTKKLTRLSLGRPDGGLKAKSTSIVPRGGSVKGPPFADPPEATDDPNDFDWK